MVVAIMGQDVEQHQPEGPQQIIMIAGKQGEVRSCPVSAFLFGMLPAVQPESGLQEE